MSLDVGEKRIGVAVADDAVRIAVPFTTIEVDGNEISTIAEIALNEKADTIIIGYPRNQQGEATAQTNYVELFAKKLEELGPKLAFQDESLTSVLAEKRLIDQKKPYTKGDIDAHAASIILQDYLEANYGY
jgi:putative Holliday junction resolvase